MMAPFVGSFITTAHTYGNYGLVSAMLQHPDIVEFATQRELEFQLDAREHTKASRFYKNGNVGFALPILDYDNNGQRLSKTKWAVIANNVYDAVTNEI